MGLESEFLVSWLSEASGTDNKQKTPLFPVFDSLLNKKCSESFSIYLRPPRHYLDFPVLRR